MASRLEWHGVDVNRNLIRAAERGITVVLAAATNRAKGDHPGWKNVTGTAEGSIQMRPPITRGDTIVGEFGSYSVDYFVHLELGTMCRAGDMTLNRAAEAEFPELPRLIQAAMGGAR